MCCASPTLKRATSEIYEWEGLTAAHAADISTYLQGQCREKSGGRISQMELVLCQNITPQKTLKQLGLHTNRMRPRQAPCATRGAVCLGTHSAKTPMGETQPLSPAGQLLALHRLHNLHESQMKIEAVFTWPRCQEMRDKTAT